MKKIFAFILSVLMVLFVMCACSDPENFTSDDDLTVKYTRNSNAEDTFNYNDGATEAPSAYLSYSNQVTDFSLRMFRYYNKNKDNDKSFVISPVSSVLQLGLIANGASKDTRTEITNAIGKNITIDDINQCSSYFKSRIEAVANIESKTKDSLSGKTISDNNTGLVRLGSNLFFNDTADIKTKFLQTNVDYYGTPAYRFIFDDSNMLTKVNNLFTDYGKDKKIDSLDSLQSLFSVTYSDICDVWLNAYAKNDLEKGKFTSSNADIDVTYMTSTETYMKTNKAQAIMKYTSKTPLKFMAVLPNKNISLDDYISDFSALELSNLMDSVDFKKNATVKIPEFSIASESKAVDITSTLEQSGLHSLFTDKASFTELTYSDDFMFNAMYEITPEISVNACGIGGTKTNGSTPALSQRTKELDKTDVTVEFNRPFIFLILDNESNIPVYIGTVKSV